MRYFYRILTFILILMILSPICLAAENTSTAEKMICFEDGSYIEIELYSIDGRATSYKTGGKTYTYYNDKDEVEWKATILGSYTFNGTTSTCTDCSIRIDIINTNWYEISQETSYSGNTAYATLTMGRKLLGVKVGERTIDLTLSCDKNGNLS